MLLLPDKSLSGKSRAQITALIPLIVSIHAYFFVQMKKGRFHTCPQNSDEKRILLTCRLMQEKVGSLIDEFLSDTKKSQKKVQSNRS